jgi:hypothetical protein
MIVAERRITMCGLCSSDPKIQKSERDDLKSLASNLESLAGKMNDLAYGTIKPHGKETEVIGMLARHIILVLVAEWM